MLHVAVGLKKKVGGTRRQESRGLSGPHGEGRHAQPHGMAWSDRFRSGACQCILNQGDEKEEQGSLHCSRGLKRLSTFFPQPWASMRPTRTPICSTVVEKNDPVQWLNPRL